MPTKTTKKTKPRCSPTAVYIRVSTAAQREDSQRHELERYLAACGMEQADWYADQASGGNTDRPALQRLERNIRRGRVRCVIVWKLDRLSRSLRDGISLLCDWLQRGVRVIAVTQDLDFAGATGQLVASVLLAVAQMEREALRERTRAGLAAARARGVKLGRPRGSGKPISPSRRKIDPQLALSLREQGETVTSIASRFNASRQGVYHALKAAEADQRKASRAAKKVAQGRRNLSK